MLQSVQTVLIPQKELQRRNNDAVAAVAGAERERGVCGQGTGDAGNIAGVVEHFGLYAATYALALERMVTPQVQVCVIGDDAAARGLEAAAEALEPRRTRAWCG